MRHQIQPPKMALLFDIPVYETSYFAAYQPYILEGVVASCCAVAIDMAQLLAIRSDSPVISIGPLAVLLVIIGLLVAINLRKLGIVPMRGLIGTAQQLTQDQSAAHFVVKSSAAISGFVRVFNAIMVKTQSQTYQLNELNMALENRVHERTIEFERQTAWLETILCDAKEAIVVTDEAGQICLINDTALTVIGKSKKEAMGHSLFELINTVAKTGVVYPPSNLYQGDLEINDRIYHYSLTHLKPSQTSTGGFVCILTDITTLHRLDTLKTQVIRMASHDLQSPLTSLRLHHHLLEQSNDLSDRQLKIIERARGSVDNLQHMVDNLLNLDHIERQAQGNCETVEIGTLLSTCVRTLASEFTLKKQQIDIRIAENIPFICGDPVRFLEAIRNYLTNAIKYTPEEGLVKARAYSDDTYVYIEVEDNGIGIDSEDVDYVFDVNFRAKTALSSLEDGQGIGLGFVKAIIAEYGGGVWVQSRVGWGSCFGFKLPIGEMPRRESNK